MDDLITAKKAVAELKDGLGRSIDAGILELVSTLRYHGVHTISSCEGHAERFTGGPYFPMRHVFLEQAITLKQPNKPICTGVC